MAFSVIDANGNIKQLSVTGTTSVTSALNRVLSTNTTIVAGTNQIVSEAVEVGAGVVFEVGDGALFEVLGGTITSPDLRRPFVAPIDTQFSWVNQGSAQCRNDGDSIVLTGFPGGSATNLQARVKTAPATPYTITAYFNAVMLHKAFNSYGLCFRESSSGKMQSLAVVGQDTGLTTLGLQIAKYTTATAFSADYVAYKIPNQINWLRIQDDGTNRICSISADGIDWLLVHSIGRTDFLTADQVGFFVSAENSTTPNFAPIARLCSWEQG